ncbi:MAG: ABC transporter permease [Eubacteriales bacterium]|nr:ABC transporter permease [Eubacteriales bacterium]
MSEFLAKIMPNVLKTQTVLWNGILETLQMVGISGLISAGFGIVFGVILVVTQKDSILECNIVYQVLDKLINVFRSIPFVILVAMLLPVTRALVGTSIGTKGAIFPLVVATVPFFSRQIHSALCEIDPGVVEAAQSMGSSPLEIILRVYLREGLPGMIRGATITLINLITLTAIAGCVGAGGLGSYAIMYGFNRSQTDVTYVTVIIILALVTIIQSLGSRITEKLSH